MRMLRRRKVTRRSHENPPTKWEIATLALSDAGGRSGAVDTEDVAMRAYQLAPSHFAWRKYPDQVNLDGVRVALTDAVKPKHGALVEGSLKSGWLLTTAGVGWADRNADRLHRALGVDIPTRPSASRSESRKRATELVRIHSLSAYRAWIDGAGVSPREAGEVFRIDADTVARTRTLNVRRLIDLFNDDPELIRFLEAMDAIASGLPTRDN